MAPFDSTYYQFAIVAILYRFPDEARFGRKSRFPYPMYPTPSLEDEGVLVGILTYRLVGKTRMVWLTYG